MDTQATIFYLPNGCTIPQSGSRVVKALRQMSITATYNETGEVPAMLIAYTE